MPVYEYRCPRCRGRFSVLVLRMDQEVQPQCPRCHTTEVQRLFSRFASPRSEEEQIESLADPSLLADVDENDPRSIARWARRMQRTLGEDLGEEFDEMIEELESGRWPEEEEEGAEGAGAADEDLGWA
ncbi:MAG: FmdB family zinc ribbon protein [Chloroflexia bacterium]